MRVWGVALLLCSTLASAQVVPERELDIVKSLFNAGNYQQAQRRALDAMTMANFSEAQRIELHKIAGLSAYNLGDRDSAERHFVQLLQLNPDYVLDPFAVAPPAIKAFEDVKRKNADALNLIRQNIAVREDQARREAAEKERGRLAAEVEKRRLEELTRTVTVRTIDRRPFITNFVPFGIGQFVQNRTEWGVFFAVTEAVFSVMTVVAYIAIELLYEDQTITIDNRLGVEGGKLSFTVRQIPNSRFNEFHGWRIVKYTAASGLGVSVISGIVDAIFHHQGDVVSSQKVRIGDADAKPPASKDTPVGLRLNFFPVSGGGGAGLTLDF